jgi:NADH:ubiquinone oxidoreductase subunit E
MTTQADEAAKVAKVVRAIRAAQAVGDAEDAAVMVLQVVKEEFGHLSKDLANTVAAAILSAADDAERNVARRADEKAAIEAHLKAFEEHLVFPDGGGCDE